MKMFVTVAAIMAALTAPALAQGGNISGNEAGGAEHGSYRATAVDKNDPGYTRKRSVKKSSAKKSHRTQVKRPYSDPGTTGAR